MKAFNQQTKEKSTQLKASLLLPFPNLTTVVITSKCMELLKESVTSVHKIVLTPMMPLYQAGIPRLLAPLYKIPFSI